MKKFFYLPLLLVIVLMTSCSKSVPSYTCLIPEDASVVVRLDIRQLSKKSGFGKSDVLKNRIKDFIKSEFSGKAKEKILAILDDPKEAGLDLRDPVFFFGGSEQSDAMGLVGAVWDADSFTELLNVVAQEASIEKVKTGDINYIQMFNSLICYNDDWFYITQYDMEQDNAKAQADNIVKRYEKGDKSIADNQGFRQMCQKRGIMQVFVKGEVAGDFVDNIMNNYRTPSFAEYEDYAYIEEEPVEEEVADSELVAMNEPSLDNPTKDLPEAAEVEDDEDAMICEPEPADNDNYREDCAEMAKKLGFELESVGVIFDFTMNRGEAAITNEIVAVKDDAKKALKELDKSMGGKQEGFCFRVNFGMLKQMAKISDSINSEDAMIMQMVANFVKYIELKYEGNCMLTLRMKTVDQDKTPLQSLVDIAMQYLQYL